MGSNPAAGTNSKQFIARVAQLVEAADLRSARCEFESRHAHQENGDEREVESGLIFNQLICEFESRHPCQKNIVDCQVPISD